MAFESNQMHLNQMQVQMQMSTIQMQAQMQMRPPRGIQMQVQMQMPHLHLQVQMHLHLNTSLVGGAHKLNEINSVTHLQIISHKVSKEYKQTVEIIKMKMFVIV